MAGTLNQLSIHSSRQAGFNLLEATVALGILALVVVHIAGSLIDCQKLAQDAESMRLAYEAAHNELEQLRALPFGTVAGTASGRQFVVSSLKPRLGSDPNHGKVQVYLNEGASDNVARTASGTGFDFDGNGVSNDVLAADSRYRVLPVSIEITWDSPLNGTGTYRLNAVLSSKKDFLRRKS
ncbi:MAG: hypothetical protein HY717_00360 [Planctomycetes bacterium]|nr:hypothetical protein [Planctomycetota bacterium]